MSPGNIWEGVLGGGSGIELIWPVTEGVLGKPVLAADADLFDCECLSQGWPSG